MSQLTQYNDVIKSVKNIYILVNRLLKLKT